VKRFVKVAMLATCLAGGLGLATNSLAKDVWPTCPDASALHNLAVTDAGNDMGEDHPNLWWVNAERISRNGHLWGTYLFAVSAQSKDEAKGRAKAILSSAYGDPFEAYSVFDGVKVYTCLYNSNHPNSPYAILVTQNPPDGSVAMRINKSRGVK